MKKVVVIGAGFAGLMALKQLSRSKELSLTLISKNDYFLFTPRITELLNSSVNENLVVRDIRNIFHNKVDFVKGNADFIDLNERYVAVGDKKLPYDFLIMASGATTDFFGNKNIEENALEYKNYNSVIRIKEKVTANIKKYSETGQSEFLTFAVIGAGLTGIELMCSLREYVVKEMEKSNIDAKVARFVMIHGPDTIAPYLEEKTRSIIESNLKDHDIEIMAGTKVENIEGNTIIAKDKTLKAATIIWAAGIKANSVNTSPEIAKEKIGKIKIIPTLEVPEHENVYVAGDAALFLEEGAPLASTAQVAFQEGIALGKNILRKADGEKAKPFHYSHKGTLIVLGHDFAILNYKKINIRGKFAWYLRDLIYRYRMWQLT